MPTALVLNLSARTRQMLADLQKKLDLNATAVVSCAIHLFHACEFLKPGASAPTPQKHARQQPSADDIARRIANLHRAAEAARAEKEPTP